MLKKILCWLLIFQHVNVYVLQAATGDIKIQFEEDVASLTPKFKLKLLQETDKGHFQSKIDTVFETRSSSSREFIQQNFSQDDDFRVKIDGSIISLISRQSDNLFTIEFNREGKTELKKFDTKNLIDLSTYGDIFAKKELKSSALSLSGKNFKNETLFKVDTLNLNLTGIGKKKGSFINGSSAQFIIGKEAHLRKGDLDNQGRITGKNMGFLDLHGNDFVNRYVGQKRDMSFHSHLNWEDQFSILNAGIFRNQTNIISSENNKNCQLTLHARKFINEAKSIIFSSQGLEISCLEDLENSGNVLSEGSILLQAAKLENVGRVVAKQNVDGRFGQTRLRDVSSVDFTNRGLILGQNVGLEFFQGKNKCLLKNNIDLSDPLSFEGIVALNTLCLQVEDDFENEGHLLGVGQAQITGTGNIHQKGILQSQGEVSLLGKNLENSNLISAGGSLVANFSEGLTNTGLISGQDNVALKAHSITNTALEEASSPLIISKNSGVDLTFQTFQNSGKISGCEFVSLGGLEGKNSGDIEGKKVSLVGREFPIEGTQSQDKHHSASKFENRGWIYGQDHLNFNVASLENLGELSSGKDLTLTVMDLRNDDSIIAESTLSLTAEGQAINNHIIQGRNESVSISAHSLKNHGLLSAVNCPLNLKVVKGDNHNLIFAQEGITFEIKSLFTNHKNEREAQENKLGLVQSPGSITISGEGRLRNHSFFESGNLINVNVGFDNTGTIHANEGVICRTEGHSSTNEGTGNILTAGVVDIENTASFTNQGHIRGSKAALTTREFLNEGTIRMKGGEKSPGDLIIKAQNGKNSGTLKATDTVDLQFAERLENSGDVSSGGNFTFESQGQLINEGLLKSGVSISLRAVKLENAGRIIAKQDVEGRFGQRESRNVSSVDFTNRGLILGQNVGLEFFQGKNKCLLKNNIDLSDPLSFEGIVALNSLCLQVEDDFENEGHLLGLRHAQITGTGNIHQKGILQSQGEVSLLGKNLENSNLISAEGSLIANFSEGLTNTGLISGQDNVALKAHSITNTALDEASAPLIISKNSGVDLTFQTFQNSGKISGCEFVSLGGLEGKNSGDIEGKKVLLVGREFSVEGTSSDLSQGQYHSASKFENSGWIYGQDHLNFNVASLENLGELNSGKDLTLTVMNLRNDDSIMAESTLSLTAEGQAINNHIIQGRNESVSISAHSLENRGLLSAVNCPLNLKVVKADNHSLIFGQGGITFQIGSLFTNHKNEREAQENKLGLVQSPGSITISGEGRLRNHSFFGSGNLININMGFDNAGTIHANEGVICRTEGHSSTNEGTGNILTTGVVDIENTASFTNQGYIEGRKATLKTRKFSNEGTIDIKVGEESPEGMKPSLIIKTENGQNSGILRAADTIDLQFSEKLENSGKVFSEGEITISGGGILENRQSGKIYGIESLILREVDLNNAGTIHANENVIYKSEGNSFINEGTGNIFTAGVVDIENTASFTNQGYIEGRKATLKTRKFSNEGTIDIKVGEESPEGMKPSLIIKTENGQNSGILRAADTIDLQFSEKLENSGKVFSEGEIIISGGGILENRQSGKIYGTESFIIREVGFDNAGKLGSSKKIKLRNLKGVVKNQTTGEICAGGDLTFKNQGHLINEGLLESGRNILLRAVKLENAGRLIAKQDVEGRFGQRELRNVSSVDFTNRGLILGQNVGLNLVKGTSRCLLKNNIDLNNPLSFEGIVALNSLCLQVEDDFENEGHLLGLRHAQISGTGNIHQKGILQSQGEVSLLGKNLENSNLISAGASIVANFSEGLTNTGLISGQDNVAVKAHSITNTALDEASPSLIVSKNLGVDLTFQTFQNSGKISGREFVSLGGLEGKNFGDIEGKKVSLVGREFPIEGTLSNPSQSKYHSGSKFENSGWIYGQDRLNLNVSSLENSGELTSGEDLTLDVMNLRNNNSITAERILSLTTDGQAINNKIIESHTLFLKGPRFYNLSSGSLKISRLTSTVDVFKNRGSLNIGEGEFIGDSFKNAGSLTSVGILDFSFKRLKNTAESFIKSGAGIRLTTNLLDNEGEVGACGDFTSTLDELVNRGTLKSGRTFSLNNLRNLRNASGGIIRSDDAIRLTANILDNEGDIEARGEFTSILYELLNRGTLKSGRVLSLNNLSRGARNDGNIISEAQLSINSTSDIVNNHIIEGRNESVSIRGHSLANRGVVNALNCPLDLNVVRGDNHNLIFGQEGITFQIGSLFTNHKNERATQESKLGLVQSLGSITISGEGRLRNHSFFESGDLININLGFDNAGTFHANKGVICRTGGQSSTNEGRGNILTTGVVDIENTAGFTNQGHIRGSKAALKTREFLNEGTISIKEKEESPGDLTIKAQNGQNSGTLRATDTIDLQFAEKLENSGNVISEKTIVSGGGSLENQQSGKIRGTESLILQEISLNNAGILGSSKSIDLHNLQGDIQNQSTGKILSDGRIGLHHIQAFHNFGKFQARDLAKIEVLQLENSGSIFSTEGDVDLLLETGSNEGTGHITAKGNLSMTIDPLGKHRGQREVINKGDIASGKKLILSGKGAVRNHKEISGQEMSIDLPVLINEGAVKAKKGLAIQLEGLSNSGLIQSTEGDIGLSLETASNEEAGRILAKGDLRMTIDPLGKHRGQRELVNKGDIASERNLTFSGKGTVRNQKEISGQEMSIDLPGLKNEGRVEADKNLAIRVEELSNSGLIQSTEGNVSLTFTMGENSSQGKIFSQKNLLIQPEREFSNSGEVESTEALSISGAGKLENRNIISSAHDLTLDLPTIVNSGELSSLNNLWGKRRDGHLTNEATGTLLASQKLILQDFHLLKNSGEIQGQAGILLTGKHLENEKSISSLTGDIELSLDSAENKGTGFIGTKQNLIIDVGGQLNNQGQLVAEKHLQIKGKGSLTNKGTLEGREKLSFFLPIFINQGTLKSEEHIELIDVTSSCVNESMGKINSNGMLDVRNSSVFTNQGKVVAVRQLQFIGNGALVNRGVLEGQEKLSILLPTLANQGTLTSEKHIELVDVTSSCVNEGAGKINSGNILDIRNSPVFTNLGEVTAARAFDQEHGYSFRKLINEGSFSLTLGDLKLTTDDFENSRSLKTVGALTLVLNGLPANTAKNTGSIQGKTLFLVGRQTFDNQGLLRGDEALTYAAGKLTNGGTLSANQTLSIQSDFTNEPTIGENNSGRISTPGQIQIQSPVSAENLGTIIGNQGITGSFKSFTNYGILSSSEKEIDLTLESGSNAGTMSALQAITLRLQNSFTNSNSIISPEGEISFLGAGHFTNSKTVNAKGAISFRNAQVTNSGSLSSHTSMIFDGVLSGVLNDKVGQNEGQILAPNLGIKNTSFLTNRGKIEVSGHLDAQLTILTNQNYIQAGTASTQATSFNNSGQVLIEGALDLTPKTGNNTGEIQAHSLTLQPTESFINSKILRGIQSISFRGDGIIQNQGEAQIFSSGSLSVKNKKLENSGHVQANGDVRVAEGAFVNTAGAKLVSTGNLSVVQKGILSNGGNVQVEGNIDLTDDSSLSNTVDAILTSHGNLSVAQKGVLSNGGKLTAKTVTYHPGTFTNGGEMRVESDISFVNCTHFQNHPNSLIVSKTGQINLPNVLSFENNGQISSQEDFNLSNVTSFWNTGTIVTVKKLTVTSPTSFNNGGKLQGKTGTDLTSTEALTNYGEILSEESISLNARRMHNYNVINGEKGVTLNGGEIVENAGEHGINSKDGEISITTNSLQNSGPIKGKKIKLDSQNSSPSLANVEAVESLEIRSPNAGFSFGGESRTFGHDVSITGPLLNLPPAGGSLQVKGNFTWNNTSAGVADFINDFNMRIDGILTITNPRGAWINQGGVEALGGTNATLHRFENRGSYYGGGNSSFVCYSDFNNYGDIRFVDEVVIEAQEGSITNHPKSEILQTSAESIASLTARYRIENSAGTIYITGKLNSNSSQFINRVQPTRVLRSKATFTTSENLPALFYAGNAYIQATFGQNIGGIISSREKIHFEGSTFQNLSQAYLCEGIAVVKTVDKRGRYQYENTPYEVPFGSDVAKFYSQGDMVIKVSGTTYTRESLARLNPPAPKVLDIKSICQKMYPEAQESNAALWNAVVPNIVSAGQVTHIIGTAVEKGFQIRKKGAPQRRYFHWGRRGRAAASVPEPESLIKNTGEIKAYGGLEITAPEIRILQFSAIETQGVVIPAVIALDMYLSDTQKSGHGFWIQDTAKQTEFLYIPSFPIDLISEESIAAQLSPENLKSKQTAEKATQEFKQWIIERWNSRSEGRKVSRRGRHTQQSPELKGILARVSALSEFWEPNVEELGKITPLSLTLAPPRIAVLNDPRLTGRERMRFHPYMLADLVSKSLLDNIGFASLSRHIFSPILLSRVLEEQGYLNARRIHGRPALPAPQNWERLSAQERIAQQLREVVFPQELEKFDTPAIVYKLMQEHGELVLSALLTLPRHIREQFQSAVGRMVAHYWGFNSTHGNTTFKRGVFVARDGVSANAANNVTTENVDMFSGKDLNLTAGGTVSLGSQVSKKVQITGKKTTSITEHKISHLSAMETINIKALKKYERGGVETYSEKGTTFDALIIEDKELYDQHNETETKKKRNPITGSKTTTKEFSKSSPVRNTDISKGPIHLKGESAYFIGPQISAPVTIFDTAHLTLKTAKTTTSSSTHTQRSNPVYQSKNGHGGSTTTHTMPEISGLSVFRKDGTLYVELPSATSQKGSQKGKHKAQTLPKKLSTQDFRQAIAKAQKDPLTAWMTPLLDHPNLRLSIAVDEFDEWKYRSQGLNVGGAVLISLAVVLATGGAAAGLTESVTTFLGGGLGASMAGTGASAGFQTLLTQAGIALANNQGNIGKTLKDLGSENSILGLVTAAGTAGLTYGLSKQLGVSQAGTSVGDNLQRSAVQTGVSTGFSIVTQDQSVGEALLQGAVNIASNTAGGLGANTIGDWRAEGTIDGFTRKALHGLLGAVLGAASNLKDPGKGALGGAIGAVSAVMMFENLPESMEAQTRADVSRAAGTVVAVAAGQDGNAALLAATNAVENNDLHPARTLEIEENRKIQSEALGEALATPINVLVEFQEGQVKRAVTEVHQLNEALRNPKLSFLERQNLRTQLTNNLEYIGRMQIFFPTTVGDVGLLGVGVLPAVGPGVKIVKDTVKASKTMAKVAFKLAPKVTTSAAKVSAAGVEWGRKLISRATPSLGKPTGSTNLLNTLDLAVKAPVKKVVTPTVSAKPSAASSVKSVPTPVQKPTSSMQRQPTSYGKSPSRPTCSSSSRSPQAPSTAPPSSSSSMVAKSSPPVGSTRPSESKIQRLSAPRGEPSAGGHIKSFVTTKDEVYYRVYSDIPKGKFLTKVPPKSQALAKEGLALPPPNKATYIQEVHVPAGTRLQRSRALPVSSWNKRGGMEQFFLINEIPATSFKEGKVFQ